MAQRLFTLKKKASMNKLSEVGDIVYLSFRIGVPEEPVYGGTWDPLVAIENAAVEVQYAILTEVR